MPDATSCGSSSCKTGGVGDDLSRLTPLAIPTGPLGNKIQLQSRAGAKGQAHGNSVTVQHSLCRSGLSRA